MVLEFSFLQLMVFEEVDSVRNLKDYEAGKTTTYVNPRTGKKCHGGAARNVRIAQGGGLAALEEKHVAVGIMIGLQQAEPLIRGYQAALVDTVYVVNQAVENLRAARENLN